MSEDMQTKITDIQTRYAHVLMEKRNVVGIGVGLAQEGGEYTQEMALVVMVEQKVSAEDLTPEDMIPRTIEGVRVDVQETGAIEAF